MREIAKSTNGGRKFEILLFLSEESPILALFWASHRAMSTKNASISMLECKKIFWIRIGRYINGLSLNVTHNTVFAVFLSTYRKIPQ
jgi:hypothetical protein